MSAVFALRTLEIVLNVTYFVTKHMYNKAHVW